MHSKAFVSGWPRWLVVVLLAFVGVGAVGAGYGFVSDPDGSSVGIPVEWLDSTPFSSFAVPGGILFALGLVWLFAAVREARRARDAWFWAGLSGGAMIVWIVVQIMMMGYTRHPLQTALQTIVLAIGLVTGVVAFVQMRATRGERVAREGGAGA